MTNTPDKSEMKAVTIPGELYAFLMGEGEIDGTAFGDLNANLPGRFWWRALLRTAASSRPPADQVPDMVEAANAVGSALDDWIRIVAVRNELNPDLRHYVWKRSPTYEEVQEAMRANNELAKAIAALQAVPAAGEVGETRVRDAAAALIADIRRRYPGEELRCEYMRELDAALKASGEE